jgi:hypothetical protein
MLYHGNHGLGQSFQLVHQAFLHQDGIRFDDVLTAEQIGQAFEDEDALFAQDEGDIYTPEIALWGALTQVLHSGVHRSCQAAVARIIKVSLQREDLRGRSPASVRREIWLHFLAYNLIRRTIAQAALTHDAQPRAVKRRPKEQDLLTEPRAAARARLLGGSSPA